MTATEIALLLSALGVGGVLREVFIAFRQRQKLGTNPISVINAAAAESVDWMRRELAAERAEHAKEVEEERAKVAELRRQLDVCTTQVQELRASLTLARVDADALRADGQRDRKRIDQLERQLRMR